MRRITITLEEDVAQWARIEAARLDTSVSRLVGEMLKQKMQTDREYEDAWQKFQAIQPRRLRDDATPYPRRG
ncbi:MAG TPA: CopG family transcriptional regulator [Thermoanaerobaculia bacterium]|nr:CopG family transcriptional regulator [Thermoanaerobaculia bacterium]